ncbi:T3SS effector HopA1 family protein [Leucobacter luti]|uniref:T3SS effector HopA1 family protein n=1 Tax=Leucobacter luti TaxID=340320 RepID=UPI00104D0A18|nr:T3SS effector HopA1 family protein [Leucobacter luti]MCW2287123.1 hypothetical protein [Leucobacter luti]
MKDGLHLEVPSHLIQASGALRLPAIRDRFTPGFAALLSSRPVPAEGVRVYIPVPYSAARQVGRLLAQGLPDLIERFVLKALTQPSDYPRSDAFTLFISPVDLEVVLKFLALEKFPERFRFAPQYSMFARAETSGVAWLEGTSSRSSGFERANCIARAYHLYATAEEELELEGLIRDELADAGIDPEAIHLYKSWIGR